MRRAVDCPACRGTGLVELCCSPYEEYDDVSHIVECSECRGSGSVIADVEEEDE